MHKETSEIALKNRHICWLIWQEVMHFYKKSHFAPKKGIIIFKYIDFRHKVLYHVSYERSYIIFMTPHELLVLGTEANIVIISLSLAFRHAHGC